MLKIQKKKLKQIFGTLQPYSIYQFSFHNFYEHLPRPRDMTTNIHVWFLFIYNIYHLKNNSMIPMFCIFFLLIVKFLHFMFLVGYGIMIIYCYIVCVIAYIFFSQIFHFLLGLCLSCFVLHITVKRWWACYWYRLSIVNKIIGASSEISIVYWGCCRPHLINGGSDWKRGKRERER